MTDMTPPLILLIDDEPVMRTITESVLGQHGFAVASATCAEQAFELLEDGLTPDLVLLDVLMPGMNGFEACEVLRRNPRLEHLPIIMLTALDDQASIDKAYRSGATDFITKPLNIPLLPHRIRYLLRSAAAFQALVESQLALINTQQIAHLGNWSLDANDIVVAASDEYLAITGAAATPVQAGHLLERVHQEDQALLLHHRAELRQGNSYQMDYRLHSQDGAGGWRHVHERGFPRCDDKQRYLGADGFTQDITERVAQEERIRELAWHDPITGLNNRPRLIELIEREIDAAAQEAITVLFVHFPSLRELSTVLGHQSAEAALRVLAGRVKGMLDMASCGDCARGVDCTAGAKLARYDEDSFVVAVSGRPAQEILRCLAQTIHDALGTPMVLPSGEVAVRTFIGIASYPDEAGDAQELVRRAMLVALRAADSDGSPISFFDPAQDQAATQHLALERGLRVALEQGGQLLPYFQPKVCAQTGRILGAEVLLRWQHPTLGMVPPMDFIPVAEDGGLIHPISEWLIGHVCEQIAAWHARGISLGTVSINLSAASFFQRSLAAHIRSVLTRTGVLPSQLVIELTESVLIQNADTAHQIISALRDLGVGVSLDDFGTGFSSLSYLNSFSIDEIKIDRSFMVNLGSDSKVEALVQAIITLGHALGLKVVAEGIETPAQAELLRKMGCDVFQGYLFARPMPAQDFGTLSMIPDHGTRSERSSA